MNTKKELLNSIAQIEINLRNEQKKLAQHKQYFERLTEEHSLLLIAMLVPTFLAGWQQGKHAKAGTKIRRFIKFSLLTAFNKIRSSYL